MLNRKLEQKGGKKSKNFQAETITINQGIRYEDARQIALDVCKVEFLDWSSKAAQDFKNRVEEITDGFLRKAFLGYPGTVSKIKDPDFQFILYDAQKEYGRTGDKDLENILITILLERMQVESTSLKGILTKEAIKIAPKLTQTQLNALSVLYLVKDYFDSEINNVEKLSYHLNKYITPLLTNMPNSEIEYRHIIYSGCCSISDYSRPTLMKYFFRPYQNIFNKGFTLSAFDNHDDYDYNEFSPGAEDREIHFGDVIEKARLILKNLIVPFDSKSDLFRLDVINSVALKKIIMDNSDFGSMRDREEIFGFYSNFMDKYTLTEQEAANLFLTLAYGKVIKLKDIFEKSLISALTLTSVGSFLAVLNLKIKLGENFQLKISE